MEGQGKQESKWKNIVTTYSYVLIWIILSALVIMLNKYILSYAGFPYPIALTLTHMGFCSLLAFTLVYFRVTEPVNMDMKTYIQCVLPIAALFSGTLVMGNATYLYLSVAFVQMIKALMPTCVYAAGCMLGTEKYSVTTVLNMMVVTLGTGIASFGELNFNLIGVLLQGSSLITESFRLVLIQLLLQSRGIKMNPIHSLMYIAPACFVMLLVPFTAKELPAMMADEDLVLRPWLLLGSALAAFALNCSVFLLIGKSSALTMNVAGVVKDWLLILLSVVLYKSPVGGLQYFGYTIAFGGVTWYNYQKMKASVSQPSTASVKPKEDDAGLAEQKMPLLQSLEVKNAMLSSRLSSNGSITDNPIRVAQDKANV